MLNVELVLTLERGRKVPAYYLTKNYQMSRVH